MIFGPVRVLKPFAIVTYGFVITPLVALEHPDCGGPECGLLLHQPLPASGAVHPPGPLLPMAHQRPPGYHGQLVWVRLRQVSTTPEESSAEPVTAKTGLLGPVFRKVV